MWRKTMCWNQNSIIFEYKNNTPYGSYMDSWSIKSELNCNAKIAQVIFQTLLNFVQNNVQTFSKSMESTIFALAFTKNRNKLNT